MILNKIKNILIKLRDLPKTIYINFHCLPWEQAKKLPIRVNWKTKFGNVDKGCIIIDSESINHNMITLGYRGSQFVPLNSSYIGVENNGKIVFKGSCTLGEGFNIYVNSGSLIIGEKFYANRNFKVQCEERIEINRDVLVGWNVQIRDTDGHDIIYNGIVKAQKEEISIGSHVWITSDVTILKGSKISDGSIIGCNSTVCGLEVEEQECLIAGIPGKVIKTKMKWIE